MFVTFELRAIYNNNRRWNLYPTPVNAVRTGPLTRSPRCYSGVGPTETNRHQMSPNVTYHNFDADYMFGACNNANILMWS